MDELKRIIVDHCTAAVSWRLMTNGATHESFCLLTNTVQYAILLYISSVSSLYGRISVFDVDIQ